MTTITQVQPGDVDTLLGFSKTTFYAAFQHLNDPVHFEAYCAVAFTREKLLSELTNSNSAFYFAYDGRKITGYIKLNTGDAQTEFKDDDSLEVERIYVSAQHQGKGIGEQLLQFAINKATDTQKQFIWLGVWEHNDKAIRFYRRQRFEVCGSHEFMVGGDRQTDLLMKRVL